MAILASLILTPFTTAFADSERGAKLFDLCTQCHGDQGDGRELFLAPAIAGMGQWYVESQLKMFQKWLDPLLKETNKNSQQLKGMRESLDGVVRSYKKALYQMQTSKVEEAVEEDEDPDPKRKEHVRRKKPDGSE